MSVTKICKICKIEKQISDFCKGYAKCKPCYYKYAYEKWGKKWNKENSSYIKKYSAKYRKGEKNKEYQKKYHKQNIVKEKQKQYREENKSLIKELSKKYRNKNKDIIKERQRKYYEKNKHEINKKRKVANLSDEQVIRKRLQAKESRKRNREKTNKKRREERKKRMEDPINRLNHNISSSIRFSLKRQKKGYHWESLVGYSLNDLKKHLESLFEPWMNWDNYGNPNGDHSNCWHIDHIIPKSYFNFTSLIDEEFKLCWSLNNLQPKEGIANISKQNRYIG